MGSALIRIAITDKVIAMHVGPIDLIEVSISTDTTTTGTVTAARRPGLAGAAPHGGAWKQQLFRRGTAAWCRWGLAVCTGGGD